MYLARNGRWSVNKLARSVTKWTQACDRRLARYISYIHFTIEYREYCHAGNAAQHSRLELFEDSDFAGDLEDSKSVTGGVLCIFGSRTFVPISWMCKKQTSVSQSLTESVNTIHPAPEIHEHFMIQQATEHCVYLHAQSQQS